MTAQQSPTSATLRVVRDDITLIDVDAFVYYAQEDLVLGTGFGNAIAQRGGPSIQKELNDLGPVKPHEVVVTDAGKLAANKIIHAVGPRFREDDMEAKIETTLMNVMQAADAHQIKRLAVPLMGRGFYGVPLQLSAKATVDSIAKYLANGSTGLSEVLICVIDWNEVEPVQAQLARHGFPVEAAK